jgi:hypothetical protein
VVQKELKAVERELRRQKKQEEKEQLLRQQLAEREQRVFIYTTRGTLKS